MSNKDRRRSYTSRGGSCMSGEYLVLCFGNPNIAVSSDGSNWTSFYNSSLSNNYVSNYYSDSYANYYQFGNNLLLWGGRVICDLTKVKSMSSDSGFTSNSSYSGGYSMGIDDDIAIFSNPSNSNAGYYTEDGKTFSSCSQSISYASGKRLMKVGSRYVMSKYFQLYVYNSKDDLLSDSYVSMTYIYDGEEYPFFVETDGTYVYTFSYNYHAGSWDVQVKKFQINSSGIISYVTSLTAWEIPSIENKISGDNAKVITQGYWRQTDKLKWSYLIDVYEEYNGGYVTRALNVNLSSWNSNTIFTTEYVMYHLRSTYQTYLSIPHVYPELKVGHAYSFDSSNFQVGTGIKKVSSDWGDGYSVKFDKVIIRNQSAGGGDSNIIKLK